MSFGLASSIHQILTRPCVLNHSWWGEEVQNWRQELKEVLLGMTVSNTLLCPATYQGRLGKRYVSSQVVDLSKICMFADDLAAEIRGKLKEIPGPSTFQSSAIRWNVLHVVKCLKSSEGVGCCAVNPENVDRIVPAVDELVYEIGPSSRKKRVSSSNEK